MKQIITSLDIGSDNIKLIVGEIFKDELFVLANVSINSKGIKKGLIVDPEEASLSIKEVFKKAEDIIGMKINKVIVTVPSYFASFVKSEGYTTINREDARINGEDITRALQASVYNRVSPNLELVSITPKDFVINEKEVVKDPKGVEAFKLSVNSILGMVPKKNVYPIISILESLNIKVVDIAFGGLSDYFEYKEDNYDKKTCAVINIGAHKTEISVVKEGLLLNTEVLEIGGRNIDRDISYIYDLTLEDSKNLKESFALAHKEHASTGEITVCLTRNNENIKINQYEVSDIVYSRVREILELAKKQINHLTKEEISYIIVTGGVTEIDGFNSVLKEIFGKNAKTNRVTEIGVRNNKYSSALGIIKLYGDKLKFRERFVSTFNEEEQEEMFNEKKKINESSILGKVYSYFFDN